MGSKKNCYSSFENAVYYNDNLEKLYAHYDEKFLDRYFDLVCEIAVRVEHLNKTQRKDVVKFVFDDQCFANLIECFDECVFACDRFAKSKNRRGSGDTLIALAVILMTRSAAPFEGFRADLAAVLGY